MTRMIMIAWPPPAMADSDDIDDGLWFLDRRRTESESPSQPAMSGRQLPLGRPGRPPARPQ